MHSITNDENNFLASDRAEKMSLVTSLYMHCTAMSMNTGVWTLESLPSETLQIITEYPLCCWQGLGSDPFDPNNETADGKGGGG